MKTKDIEKRQRKMTEKGVIDVERALCEKRAMQKIYKRKNGCPSSVLALVIAHFEGMKKKK